MHELSIEWLPSSRHDASLSADRFDGGILSQAPNAVFPRGHRVSFCN